MNIKEILAIGCGGFIGAISRYFVSGWLQNIMKKPFPYGTMGVNILGSLILGILMGITLNANVSPYWKLSIGIGFLGAFTTFSTFSYETMMLMRAGAVFEVFMNIAASIILGLIAVFIGYLIGNAII